MLRASTPEQFAAAQGSQAMVDGLWQGPTALTLDYVNVVRRIKLLGFNAVRLPFSMQVTVDTAGVRAPFDDMQAIMTGSTAYACSVTHLSWCIWQVIFGADPAGSIAAACPVFPDVNTNPTSEDILASVTHPSTQLPAGTINVFTTVQRRDASLPELVHRSCSRSCTAVRCAVRVWTRL